MKRLGIDQETYERYLSYGDSYRKELRSTEYRDDILQAEKEWLLAEDPKITLEKWKIWNKLMMEQQTLRNEEDMRFRKMTEAKKEKLTKKQDSIIQGKLASIPLLGLTNKAKLYHQIRWKCENDNNFPSMEDCINVCVDMVKNGTWMKPVGMK